MIIKPPMSTLVKNSNGDIITECHISETHNSSGKYVCCTNWSLITARQFKSFLLTFLWIFHRPLAYFSMVIVSLDRYLVISNKHRTRAFKQTLRLKQVVGKATHWLPCCWCFLSLSKNMQQYIEETASSIVLHCTSCNIVPRQLTAYL